MVSDSGELILEQAMYRLEGGEVQGELNRGGYYVTNSDGCFEETPLGLQYISKIKYKNGYKELNYIVYVDSYGLLTRGSSGLRYISNTTVNGVEYQEGYYGFNSSGRMYTDSRIGYVKAQTVNDKAIKKGYYYFGKNGRMETDILYKKNESGSYLKKSGKSWYCYDKSKKPLSGMQYIAIFPDKSVSAGYYMTASDGKLILEKAMYKLKKQVVHGVTFEGYYISDTKGCFKKAPEGLKYVSSIKYNNGYKALNSFVYMDAYGLISRSSAGLRYIPTETVNKVNFKAGYYCFRADGRMYTNSSIRPVKKQVVDGKTIKKGYYYFGTNGRMETGTALRYVKKRTVEGLVLKTGYYYFSSGRLKTESGVRYMTSRKASNNVSFSTGYYCFDKNGCLSTSKKFRTLKVTVNSVKFDGTYYFGDTNAKLYTKSGWITVGSQRYYLDSSGKRLENCWHDGYYLQADGTIAKNKKVPDGSWVDWQGKKCKKNEVALSELKSSVTSIVSRYSGSWSVYVKNLETGDIINLNEIAMYPASTIKAFVMASTYEQIKNNQIAYTSTIKRYLNEMITVTDNEAYNQLIKRQTNSLDFNTGFSVINKYLQKNGYKNTVCHTTLSPSYTGYRSDGKGSNRTTAKDCGVLLEKIYKGTCVSKQYSKEMLNLLLAQQRT